MDSPTRKKTRPSKKTSRVTWLSSKIFLSRAAEMMKARMETAMMATLLLVRGLDRRTRAIKPMIESRKVETVDVWL